MDISEAGKCPLCNNANQCAVAAGKPPESCWCQTASIAPEALAALPGAEQGVRCICPRCASNPKGVNLER